MPFSVRYVLRVGDSQRAVWPSIMATAGSAQRASARKNSPGLFGGGVARTRRDGQ